MSRTTKPLQKLKPDSSIALSNVAINSRVIAINVFTEEVFYGVIIDYTEGDDGVLLRRSDEYGNTYLRPAQELKDNEYLVKEVDGRAV